MTEMSNQVKGLESKIAEVASESSAEPARVEVLLDRYGATARLIAAHERDTPVLFDEAPAFGAAEIDWIARNEQVVHLEDVILRRTPLAITGQLTKSLLERIGRIVGAALNWNDERIDAEIARTLGVLESRHGVRF